MGGRLYGPAMLTKRGLEFNICDLAPLSAGLPPGAATVACAAIALDLVDGEAPVWLRLLAPGENTTRDGRGPFKVDAARVVALSRQLANGVEPLIDYEHQFDNAPKNGQPAPASGWIEQFADKGPGGEPGVWAKLRWNGRAREMIKAGEYRYLSPVLAHDKGGNVLAVVRAALTNYPALMAPPSLFTVSPPQTKEAPKMELVQFLATLFGVANDEKAIIALATKLKEQISALCTTLGVDLVALSGMTGAQLVAAIQAKGVDPAAFVPIATHNAVTGELATLRTAEIGRLVEGAIREGKATPAQKDWLTDLGKSDLAKLTTFLSAAPVILPPGQQQPPQQEPPGGGEVRLSEADLALCRSMGIDVEAFKKQRAAELAEYRAVTGKEF